jgi:hypothetical protein
VERVYLRHGVEDEPTRATQRRRLPSGTQRRRAPSRDWTHGLAAVAGDLLLHWEPRVRTCAPGGRTRVVEPVAWNGARRVWGARRHEVDLRRGRRATRSGQAAAEAGLLGWASFGL